MSNNKNPGIMIMTDSTHANSNSDANHGSIAQKRLKSQQNYISNVSAQAYNALAMNQMS